MRSKSASPSNFRNGPAFKRASDRYHVAIHLRDEDDWVVEKIKGLDTALALSILSLVELEAGVLRNPDLVAVRRAVLNAMLKRIGVLSLDRDVIAAYGRIVGALGYSRARVIDRLIAATAIVNDLTLITINGADFQGIPGLDLRTWSAPAQ